MYIDLKTKQEQSGRLEELLIQLVFLYQQTLQCVFSSKYDNEKNGGSFFIRTATFLLKEQIIPQFYSHQTIFLRNIPLII